MRLRLPTNSTKRLINLDLKSPRVFNFSPFAHKNYISRFLSPPKLRRLIINGHSLPSVSIASALLHMDSARRVHSDLLGITISRFIVIKTSCWHLKFHFRVKLRIFSFHYNSFYFSFIIIHFDCVVCCCRWLSLRRLIGNHLFMLNLTL